MSNAIPPILPPRRLGHAPPRLRVRRGHRVVPDRGRGPRPTAACRRSGTRSAPPPARRTWATAATSPATTTTATKQDVALLADLGFDAYRFSIAWPRVMDANGRINDKRRRLLQAPARSARRTRASPPGPRCTTGTCRSTCRIAAAGSTARRPTASPTTPRRWAAIFKGRMAGWMTLNEPYCSAFIGHTEGRHAPGLDRRALRRRGDAPPAAGPRPGHDRAARQRRRARRPGRQRLRGDAGQRFDRRPRRHRARGRVLQPLAARPAVPRAATPRRCASCGRRRDAPIRDGDMAAIGVPLDFIGINYYFRQVIAQRRRRTASSSSRCRASSARRWAGRSFPTACATCCWSSSSAIRTLPPVYITENGMASDDAVSRRTRA